MSASIYAHRRSDAGLPTFCAVFETHRGPVCSAKCSGYEANALKKKSSGRAQQILREWYRSHPRRVAGRLFWTWRIVE